MKKLIVFCALLLSTMIHAEIVKLNGLYYSLGNTTATVVKDQTTDKSVYSQYTTAPRERLRFIRTLPTRRRN